MGWTSCSQEPPIDKPILLYAREWGNDGGVIVAIAHKLMRGDGSSHINYVFDRSTYGLNRDWFVGAEARCWMEIPQVPKEYVND